MRKLKSRILNLIYESKGQYNSLINKRYYSSIRNRYVGKRGFVVCNGPSLNFADLDKLTAEISIASNKIYLGFPHTKWRPNYFTVQDPLVWEKVKEDIHKHFSTVHIENTPYLPYNKSLDITIRAWNSLEPVQNPFLDSPKFSNDLSIGLCNGYSITYANLQLAAHLGLNPIYLIGCDHNYDGESKLPANTKLTVLPNQHNHFIKGYREPGEIVYNAPIDDLTEAFKNAKAFSDSNNISIFNATRGGNLEVFERIDFDELFD